jgi:hypothetical protein
MAGVDEHPRANLILSVATLATVEISRCPETLISEVQDMLGVALRDKNCYSLANAILGVVKHEFFWANGRYEGRPAIREIAATLREYPLNPSDQKLLRHLQVSPAALKALGLPW